MGRENTEEETWSGGTEAATGLEDKGKVQVSTFRVRYRCVWGGDPSIMQAFGLLLVLGRAVLIDRREDGVLQVGGASRTNNCNID